MQRGKLIVLEGGEGSGKTTQLHRLYGWLRSLPHIPEITITHEPGGCNLGQMLRHLLLDSPKGSIDPTAELLLYAADRAQHVARVIEPCLKEGKIVLCDRYTHSTVAYQGYGRNLDLRLIDRLNTIATRGLQPDLTLWLDVDPALGLSRTTGEADRIEQEDLDFHCRVRSGYAHLAVKDIRMECVNARGDANLVELAIRNVVGPKLMEWYPGITKTLLRSQRESATLS